MLPSTELIHSKVFLTDEDRKKYFINLFYNLMNIDPIEYTYITNQINSTNYNNIFLSSDLHFLRDSTSIEINKIKSHNKTIRDNSIWIYLGDLGYKHIDNAKLLKSYVMRMNKGKFSVMVLGNHDIYGKEFYKSKCGFNFVCRGFISNNIIFTHIPVKPNKMIENNYDYNICGHLHINTIIEYAQRYSDFKNIIDLQLVDKYKIIYNKGNNWAPISLENVLFLKRK